MEPCSLGECAEGERGKVSLGMGGGGGRDFGQAGKDAGKW